MSIRAKMIAALAAGAMLVGCDKAAEERQTQSGYKYYHVVENDGEKPETGQIVQFHFTIYNDADSVLDASDRSMVPPPSMPMMAQDSGYLLSEGLRLCTEGDSILFTAKAEQIFGPRVPPFVQPQDDLKLGLKVVAITTREELQKERANRIESQKDVDEQIIVDYINDNELDGEVRTESGLYYIITKEGKGPKPATGSKVKVHYTGTLLDGTTFDSSVDRGEPIEFPLGKRMVIAGWDEGIAKLNKGAKATFLIPSHLAYGERGAGRDIKPFSVLRFDVELVSFEEAE